VKSIDVFARLISELLAVPSNVSTTVCNCAVDFFSSVDNVMSRFDLAVRIFGFFLLPDSSFVSVGRLLGVGLFDLRGSIGSYGFATLYSLKILASLNLGLPMALTACLMRID